MRRLGAGRYVLSSCAAAALLAGCGGSQPPIGEPSAMPQSHAAARAERSGSWMLPGAKSQALLYVTNYSTVLVFAYPEGTLMGTLKGFYSNVGECVDANGDVFVANEDKPTAVYEYAHGSDKRIATLRTKHVGPIGCAVNPTSGDLAVSGNSDSIYLFKHAKGAPVVIKDSRMFDNQFCAYDDKGDLFVDGLQNATGTSRLAELPSGGRTFLRIKLNAPIDPEAGIQWDEGYLAMLSYVPFGSSQSKPVIYRFAINGTHGTKVDTMRLGTPARTVLQYFIFEHTLFAPNLYVDGKDEAKGDVLLYRYPSGRAPMMVLTKHISAPRGVVLSRAQ